ncbi:MAG: integrase core domain-containing protein [Weeksellaceae bacterium]
MGLGEKKEIVTGYISQGLRSRRAFKIAGITKHQYYYRPKKGKRGRKASTHTLKTEEGKQYEIPNQEVVEEIEKVKKDPDLDYGYHAMAGYLQLYGWHINHKKAYRLMKENGLLKPANKKPAKNYVKYRKVLPKAPLEVIEMDIKMVWVERDRRFAYILNVIDTFTRKLLHQIVGFSITSNRVKQAWGHIVTHHLQPNDSLNKKIHIEIRNDNDKRFSAKIVQEFFKENYLNQIFTHPYTPQENGHVESFHAILGNHLKRFTFWSLDELEQDLIVFMEKYNNQRLHGSLAHLAPNDFELLWQQNLIQTKIDEKQRKIAFKLTIPRHLAKQYTGNNEPEGSLSPKFSDPPFQAVEENFKTKEMNDANISNNIRYKKSPPVVSRIANISTKIVSFELEK